ncbi:hypothetical protein [Nocardia nova]|uniref:hypothetical protein n=1 Tax=Nocardia nova TaxID=37330 RepID=UPI0011B027E3|nr:hypothetical protein [Nocardia nova]
MSIPFERRVEQARRECRAELDDRTAAEESAAIAAMHAYQTALAVGAQAAVQLCRAGVDLVAIVTSQSPGHAVGYGYPLDSWNDEYASYTALVDPDGKISVAYGSLSGGWLGRPNRVGDHFALTRRNTVGAIVANKHYAHPSPNLDLFITADERNELVIRCASFWSPAGPWEAEQVLYMPVLDYFTSRTARIIEHK